MTEHTTETTPEPETEEVPEDHEQEVEERVQEAYRIVGHPGPQAGIISRLNYVQQLIDYVAKTGVSDDNYKFRTIDGVLAALHNPLGEAGVVVFPQVKNFYERTWLGYQLWKPLIGQTKQILDQDPVAAVTQIEFANPNRLVRLRIHYEFECEPIPPETVTVALLGSKAPVSWIPPKTRKTVKVYGEGIDNADKAVGKAMSYAYKAAMSQIFSIPTEDPSMDTEYGDSSQIREQGGKAEDWWTILGWESETHHNEARKELFDASKKGAMPEQTNAHLKKWMQSYDCPGGGAISPRPLFDKKSVAPFISLGDAQAWRDKLDELEDAATREAAGEDPFLEAPEEEGEKGEGGSDVTPELAVLEAIADSERPLTITRVAEATGLSRGESSAVLDRLANDGKILYSKVGRNSVYSLLESPDDPDGEPEKVDVETLKENLETSVAEAKEAAAEKLSGE